MSISFYFPWFREFMSVCLSVSFSLSKLVVIIDWWLILYLKFSTLSFLDDLERITSLKYMPTDDDVLKARLKTVGVCEYKFEMEVSAGRDSGTEWRIVDVGGSRSQRRACLLSIYSFYLFPFSMSDVVQSLQRLGLRSLMMVSVWIVILWVIPPHILTFLSLLDDDW